MKILTTLFLLAAMAAPATAGTYISSEGHQYNLRCAKNGYELTSVSPVARIVGYGTGRSVVKGKEKLSLGKNCDASTKVFGPGKWCWANGGFWARFPEGADGVHEYGFVGQELFCQPEPAFWLNCRC